MKPLPFAFVFALAFAACPTWASDEAVAKPGPAEALAALKAGNERFAGDQPAHPHGGAARRTLSVKDGQAKHAIATVLSCSDSRVPPELLFDAGVMDLFVVRAAGNPANADEVASIEYGLAHVKTPVLVVLGHSQCGAVTAAVGKAGTEAGHGGGHGLEPNIEPLVNGLVPAVQQALARKPGASGQELIDLSIEENVWLAVTNLLRTSEVARKLVLEEKVVLAPAVYDLESGKVRWLSRAKVFYFLGKMDAGRN